MLPVSCHPPFLPWAPFIHSYNPLKNTIFIRLYICALFYLSKLPLYIFLLYAAVVVFACKGTSFTPDMNLDKHFSMRAWHFFSRNGKQTPDLAQRSPSKVIEIDASSKP